MGSKSKRQSFLEGAVILAVSTIVVKALGALFKVPLMNLLGGTGMAYFMTAYEIFNPIYALSIAGFPAAVSRLVSESVAQRRYRDARKIVRLSVWLFLAVGGVGFCLLFFGSGLLCRLVGNPDARLAVAMLAPSLLFGCVTSAVRGYYQGMRNMIPTAVSQVVEAVAKLVLGIGLCYGTFVYALQGYADTGAVFGRPAADLAAAKELAMPYAAAGAILGVALSTLASAVYLGCKYKFGRETISPAAMRAAPRSESARSIARRLAKIALPVCLGTFAVSLTSVIDLFSVMNSLEVAAASGADLINRMYGLSLPAGQIPAFLYGAYSGIGVTLYNLIPALTATFATSALPAVTAAYVSGGGEPLKKGVRSVFRMTSVLCIPAGLGLAALSRPILELLYAGRPQEIAAVAPSLTMLGLAGALLGYTAPVYSMLQGVGRAEVPVKLMGVGALIKLGCNLTLCRLPQYNLKGAALGTLLCYLFIAAAALVILTRQVGFSLGWGRSFFGPLLGGALCAVGARLSCPIFAHLGLGRMAALPAILLGAAIYLVTLLCTGSLEEGDLLALPGGKKLAPRLARWGLL